MIDIENLSSFSIDEKNVKNYVGQMLKHLGVNKDSYVSILFVEENEMASQHLKWMKEPGPTDVMSFPMDDVLLSNKKRKIEITMKDNLLTIEETSGNKHTKYTSTDFTSKWLD